MSSFKQPYKNKTNYICLVIYNAEFRGPLGVNNGPAVNNKISNHNDHETSFINDFQEFQLNYTHDVHLIISYKYFNLNRN